MAKKKYDLITELYAGAVKEVTAKPEHWMSFLNSACRNFRMPFDEQLLVHVQRPNATAVLEMEAWNRKFGRWVKRGSKGIAVIDKNSPVMRLKYYFDVSETQEGRYHRLVRPVPLWTVDDKNRERVRETLVNAFGVPEGVEGLAETIREAAKNAAEDNLSDYLPDILAFRKDSTLEGAEKESVEAEAEKLLENSIAYMVMIRCGIDEREHPDVENFQGITKFNTPELVNLFGVAVSDVAEMALSEISDTIWKLQLEEKKKKRTFAGREAEGYTGLETPENNHERSLTYDDDRIQQTGRLPSSKPYRTPRTGTTPWEVRLLTPEVSEGTPLRDLSEPSDAGELKQPPAGNAGNGAEQNGADHGGNGRGAGRDRGAESTGSDSVGAEDEQHPSGGGRNRDEGSGIRLVREETEPEQELEPLQTVEEQLSLLDEMAEEQTSVFSFSQEMIDTLIRTVGDKSLIKYQIYSYFQKNPESRKKAQFLKRAYGAAGYYPAIAVKDMSLITDEKGMRIYRGETSLILKWEKVAKRIDELISIGRYLSKKEIEYLPKCEKNILCAEIYEFYKEIPKGQISPYPSGTDYDTGTKIIRGQIEDPEAAGNLLESMGMVLGSMEESDRLYKFKRRVYQDLLDYRDDANGLPSSLPAEKEDSLSVEPEPAVSRESAFGTEPEQEQKEDSDTNTGKNREGALEPEPIRSRKKKSESAVERVKEDVQEPEPPQSSDDDSVSGTDDFFYDLHPETVVYIGIEEYEIQFLSDEMVVLHDLTYPLFTKEMTREEFEQKLRENPANDHLRQEQPEGESLLSQVPTVPAEKPAAKEQDTEGTLKPPTEKKQAEPSAASF